MELREISVHDAELFLTSRMRGFKRTEGVEWALGLTCDGQLNGVIVVGRAVGPRVDGELDDVRQVHHLHISNVPEKGKHELAMLYAAAHVAARERGVSQLRVPVIMPENVEVVR